MRPRVFTRSRESGTGPLPFRPATADLVSRLALGMGDNLVTTVALALAPGVPRFLCPAMNPNMLAAPPVARNLAQLVEDGWRMIEPGDGHLACGVEGRVAPLASGLLSNTS